jgi:hypothetical protein
MCEGRGASPHQPCIASEDCQLVDAATGRQADAEAAGEGALGPAQSRGANGPELRLETLAESRRTLRTFTPGGKEEKPGLNSP